MVVMAMSSVVVLGGVARLTALQTGVGVVTAVIPMLVMTMLVHGHPPRSISSRPQQRHANAPRERLNLSHPPLTHHEPHVKIPSSS
jgi:hypothetical protein